MKKAVTVVATLLITALLASAADLMAQTPQPMPQYPAPARPGGTEAPGGTKPGEAKKEIEGKIKSVQASGAATRVVLEDGTQLMIPASVRVERAGLKQGAIVKATYEDNRGQKIVTEIEVRPEKS